MSHSVLARAALLITLLVAWSTGVSAESGPIEITAVGMGTGCPVTGEARTWTATAAGGTEPLEYQFWLRNDTAGTWTLLQDYSQAGTAQWTPASAGVYFLQVWARSAGSTAAWEAWRNSDGCTSNDPAALTLASVAASPAATPAQNPVTLTAEGSGGVPPLQYRFWLHDDATGNWTILQDYSASKTATWTPTTVGTYLVQTWARAAGSAAEWEAWRNSDTVVITPPPPPAVTLVSAAPASSTPVGAPVTWSATARGGPAPLQYRFWLRNDTEGTWTVLQDYSNSRTATWTPSAAGSYLVQVWVRSAGSTAAWEAWGNSETHVVVPPPPLTITSVSPSPPSSASIGVPVTWSVTAINGLPPLQYRFWLYDDTAGAWTILRDYGPSSTATWTPAAPGSYFVQVWVRSSDSTAPWEAWRNSDSIVAAEGPPQPEWTVVVSDQASQTITWAAASRSDRYRVYRASSRQALLGRLPASEFFEATASPLTVSVVDSNVPQYYRVFGLEGPIIGAGGQVAVSTVMQPIDFELAPLTVDGDTVRPSVSTALWDVDGDGCLDMVGARGMCDGRFEPYAWDQAGLSGLFATGRVNRDSRFADFNGDGRTDIFTNVYSQATDSSSRAILHLGNGTGGFTEDLELRAMGIGGFGETIVAADFDNDGDVDIFLPHYSHAGDGGHNWLLINDGTGHFTDMAETAGVADNLPYTPEGAQAIDFNQDGWIDIVVSSHLYLNNGNLTFADNAANVRLPARFDEGMRLVDLDMDGDFDLVHHDGYVTKLYRNLGGVFDEGTDVDGSPDFSTFGYGLNVCDINGDGFEDVVVANNGPYVGPTPVREPHLLINVGGTLMRSKWVTASYGSTI